MKSQTKPATGKVKFFDTEKCFGFIITPENEELYVHAGDLIDLVRKNDSVNYEVQEEDGKRSAFNVRLLKSKN